MLRNQIFSLLIASIFVLANPLSADSFAIPKPIIISSPSCDYIARITPGHPSSGGSKATNSKCAVLKYDPSSESYHTIRTLDLLNPVRPLIAVLPDDGSYLATIDDYFDNTNAVVLYDDHGNVMKSWTLEDLFSKDELSHMKLISTAVLWHGDFKIVSRDQNLILISAADPQGRAFIIDVRSKTIKSVPINKTPIGPSDS